MDPPRHSRFVGTDHVPQRVRDTGFNLWFIDEQYTMYMVWHHLEIIEPGSGIVQWYLIPAFVSNRTEGVEEHLFIFDGAEDAAEEVSADGDEIGPGHCIIVTRQARVLAEAFHGRGRPECRGQSTDCNAILQ